MLDVIAWARLTQRRDEHNLAIQVKTAGAPTQNAALPKFGTKIKHAESLPNLDWTRSIRAALTATTDRIRHSVHRDALVRLREITLPTSIYWNSVVVHGKAVPFLKGEGLAIKSVYDTGVWKNNHLFGSSRPIHATFGN